MRGIAVGYFVTFLAVRLINAIRAGFSAVDTTRFAVALYHGMSTMVRTAQAAVKDDINWAPVEAELLRQGHRDEVAYVHEVVGMTRRRIIRAGTTLLLIATAIIILK